MRQKRLSQDIFHGNQSWDYQALWIMGDNESSALKLRIRIKRDAYDNQSYRLIEVFDHGNSKWNELWTLPFETANCKPINYAIERERLNTELFELDEEELLKKAIAILE